MFNKLFPRIVSLDEELNALTTKMQHLEALESDNSTLVKNGEIQPGKKRKREVDLWFTNVEKKKSQLQQIEIEFEEKSHNNNLMIRIEKLTKEVEELIQQGKFPKGVVLDDHESTRVPMMTTRLVGRHCLANIELILCWIKEDDVSAIGIHGMGGVGKTTLIKHIYNNLLKDSEIQGNVYWVTASQECSLQKLQIDIGKAIGLADDLSQYDNERRKARLYARFTDLGQSVLIIDDLWQHYLPEAIGIPVELCRCKIVLTSRSLDVCNRMKCQKTIKIETLSRPYAFQLFSVTFSEVVPGELIQVAEEIVAECGGLPLALITMGACMRGIDDVHEWQNALSELRKPMTRQDSMEEEVFRVLKFSYNNLKDEKIQHCFLSCVLFPEDFSIPRDELVALWISERLLDEAESEQDKVNKGQSILNRLEKSCLLESTTWGNKKSVKMHDLIRDMAIIITHDLKTIDRFVPILV